MKLLAELLGMGQINEQRADDVLKHMHYDDEGYANDIPSGMNQVFDDEEDSEEDGYYWIGYVGNPANVDLIFSGGVALSYNDAVYYAKKQARANGGNVEMNANFQIIKGFDEFKRLLKEFGESADGHYSWKAS